MIAPTNCPRCNIPLFEWSKPSNVFLCAQSNCRRFEFQGTNPIRLIRITLNPWLLLIHHNYLRIINNPLTIDIQGNFQTLIHKDDNQILDFLKNILVFQ